MAEKEHVRSYTGSSGVLAMLALLLLLGGAFALSASSPATEARAAEARAVRAPDSILGRPIYGEARVKRYARSIGSTRYILRTIPIYYRLAPRRGLAPDVLIAQAILETGRGHYGGDSRPWNMAGIKKGGRVGDAPRDFERMGELHKRRLAALPGMTGYWQISGRSDLPFEEMVRLDLYYIENWSLSFDLKIILKTIGAVLGRRGAY